MTSVSSEPLFFSSSSSSPPKKKQKTVSLASSVYISVYKGTEASVIWYVLNTDARGDDITFSELPQLYSTELPMFFGCATLDSHIYLVGGKYRCPFQNSTYDSPCKNVHVFNTISSTWMRNPPPIMQANRLCPVVIPIHKRLYVFGGKGILWSQPWAEYLDLASSNQIWHSLSPPPLDIRKVGQILGHAVFKDGQSIVFWVEGLFFFYNVVDDIWSTFKTNQCPLSTVYTVVHDVLFWYDKGGIYAYDLANNSPFDTPIYRFDFLDGMRIEFYVHDIPQPFLVGTDNAELFIIWGGSDSVNQFQVSFVKIRIKFEKECIVPEYVCSETFNVPGVAIYCCMGMKPHKGEEHKLVDETTLVSNAESGDAVLRLKFEKMGLQEAKQSKVGGQQSLMEQLSLFMHQQSSAGALLIVNKSETSGGVRPKTNKGFTPERKVVKTVHDLLQSLGLQEYMPIFQENKIEMSTLTSMEDKELQALKIPMGPRRKILYAVRSLR